MPLNSARSTQIVRTKMLAIGVGGGDARKHTAHSLKRCAVQLYRTLRLRDECVMQKVQMVGSKAYASYCAGLNDCAPTDLSRFAWTEDFIGHAERMMDEKNLLLRDNVHEEFMSEVTKSLREMKYLTQKPVLKHLRIVLIAYDGHRTSYLGFICSKTNFY